MGMGRPVGSGTTVGLPTCPQHTDSRVVLNGKYGGTHPRQRFRCIPATGAPKHNFAGPLAHRVLTATASCPACDTRLKPHQGPALARRYEFGVTDVATALVRVGRGMSYTEAAQRCRAQSRRGGRVSAQLVGNWVEVFAPVVATRYAEATWPETVACDSTPFFAPTPGNPSQEVFSVFVLWGYEQGAREGRAVAIVASTRRNSGAWAKVFSSKRGQPTMLVSDGDQGILAGAAVWPGTVWRPCRWHLRQNLDRQLAAYNISTTPANPHPIGLLAAKAFLDLLHWQAFARAVRTHGGVNLVRWVTQTEPALLAEFAAGPLPRHYSNGAAEEALKDIRPVIEPRAFCYRNAERTNRMLELFRLRLNHWDNVNRYAADIRHYVTGGGPLSPQMQIVDPKGQPSLR